MPFSNTEFIVSGGGLLVILLTFIQISPIKVNPWSSLARSIGKAINSDIVSKFDDLDEKINNLEENLKDLKADCEKRDATLCRTHILRFGDEILHGMRHSYEHYQNVLLDIDVYEKYCSTHPLYKNNLAKMTIELIKKTYKESFNNKDFL